MMPIWEYEGATINVADRKAQLDAFGRDGWELVQFFGSGGRSWYAVFKREVKPAERGGVQ